MQYLSELWRRLLYLFGLRRFDRELEEEMQFHLEMAARELGPDAARRRFGNTTILMEDSRSAWGWTPVEMFLRDAGYAVRTLRKNPAFTAVAMLILALGIGATTAVFSVVHGVLLRPLPFRDPDRLAMIWQSQETWGDRAVVSLENFRDWERQSQSFERMAAFQGDSARMFVGDELFQILGARVTRDFFPVLGVTPFLGRGFLPEEERPGAPPAVLLSYGFWQRLGGERSLIGRTITLDRDVLKVVGVLPRGFAFPFESQLWLPYPNIEKDDFGHHLRVIGRLKPGVSVAQAQTEMATIAARLRAVRPLDNRGIGTNVVPLMDQIVGDSRRALLMLMGAVVCVLLIACANMANLLLVRGTARDREVALRLALGASRWRILRHFLAESILLAAGGGMLGIAAAYLLVDSFVAFDPIHLPRVHEVAVDGEVLLFAFLAASVTGIAFGLAPALRATRTDPARRLNPTSRGRNTLAIAQMALSVVLLVSAGLLLRSFVLRVTVPLGFRPEGVLVIELPWWVHQHVDELLDRLRSLPGVDAAGAATTMPQDAAGISCDSCLEIERQPKRQGKQFVTGRIVATPEYLRAADMTVQKGRFFTRSDGATAPRVAVVNEALARRDFAGQDPIGRHVRWSGDWTTIVGVASNVKGFGVDGDPMPAVYFPHLQSDWNNGVQVLVRTSVPPLSLAAAVRAGIHAWNRRIIIGRLDTLDNMLDSSVAVPRFYLFLVSGFALLALAVSAVGVYGTMSYSVARRTHEFGIRIALGIEPSELLTMILAQGLALTAAGLVLGLIGARLATRALETMLFGIRPADPASFMAGAGILLIASLSACLIPAWRATRVDPLEVLRHE